MLRVLGVEPAVHSTNTCMRTHFVSQDAVQVFMIQ